VNVVQLRDTIDTLLGASPNLIGTYTLPNEAMVPAIYTVGRQSVPSDWRATGLEVTIREFQEQLPTAMVGTLRVLQQWEVMLVQYTSSSSTLSAAVERLTRRFPDGTFRYLPGNDVVYDRCRIIIPDTILRNVYPGI